MADNWAPWTAPIALLTALGAALVGALLVGVGGAATGASISKPPPEVDILATAFQDAALVATAAFFGSRVGGFRTVAFGLRPTAIPRAARTIVLGYVGFVVFSIAWAAALGIRDREKIVDQLGANQSDVALVAVVALTCVIAPIAEEFFFRAYFYRALRNWRGVWPAALLTGLTFGLIHIGSAPAGYLVPLALFGAVLCWVYERTGSLYPCVVLHVLNNCIAFGITEHWGWQIPVVVAAALSTVGCVALVVARVLRAE